MLRIGPLRKAAHPRSRGENGYQLVSGDLHEGSSPLTRGKLTGWHDDTLDGGLIPAHAGKTSGASP